MLKRSTLLVLSVLAPVTFAESGRAESCSEVDSKAMKILADAFGVDETELTSTTRLSGRFRLDEAREEILIDALEENLDITDNEWSDEIEWNTVQDVLEEVRQIKGCGRT